MDQAKTLQDLVHGLAAHGDRPAVIAVGADGKTRELSYRQLSADAYALARGLARRGVGAGTPVAILSPNRMEWVIARLAIIAVGALAVPMDDLVGDKEMERVLSDSGARHIFTTGAYGERLRALLFGGGLTIWRLDEDEGAESWRGLLGADGGTLAMADADAPVALFYTSGTTGPPKGVPLSHANLLANLKTLAAGGFIHGGDRVLCPLPFHHSYPFLIGMLMPLAYGRRSWRR
jgi:long-chain acyl-CoA synthetase